MEAVFVDKTCMPTEELLEDVLNESYLVFKTLKEKCKQYKDITYEWKMYTKKAGWTLLVKQKKRTLFYILPRKNYFHVSFVFGDRAVEVLENSNLHEDLKKELKDARKYMEGKGLQVSINAKSDLQDVLLLLKTKVEV